VATVTVRPVPVYVCVRFDSVTVAAGFTVSVTALLLADPTGLVLTALNSLPDSVTVVLTMVSVAKVEPKRLPPSLSVVHVVPWSVEICHR